MVGITGFKPSAIDKVRSPPRLRIDGHSCRIHGGYLNADPGAVALVSSQSAPERTLQSLMIIRMSQATSSTYSIARTKYAVVICFIHFATTPSTNLSIPLAFGLPPSSPSSGEWKGEAYTVYTVFSLSSDLGAVALVSSQSAPEYTTQSLMIIRMSQATSS